MENISQQISEIILKYGLFDSNHSAFTTPILKHMQSQVNAQQKLIFILPAFPAKSPNRNKTFSDMPDYGEVLALINLQKLCDAIADIYPFGAELKICSDGRVFSDVVNVPDPTIDTYNQEIKKIIQEYHLTSLTVLSMDDLHPSLTPDELRKLLLDEFAMSTEEVKELVLSDIAYRKLFNGLHKFLTEDEMALQTHLTKTAAQRLTKEKTYELLRRSDAWSEVLKKHFPEALRLSIHPHSMSHEKFGIKLIPSSNKWATPWHNVVVKFADHYELMHIEDALKLNAVLRMEKNKYAYYEIPAA